MREHFKKIIVLISAALTFSIVSVSNTNAQNSEAYLRVIAQNTTEILQRVNTLPAIILLMMESTISWLAPDTSEETASLQGGFTQLGNLLTQNLNAQYSMQEQLNKELLGINDMASAGGNTSMPSTAPSYANDLVYSTVLGNPFYSKDPRNPAGGTPTTNPVYNYIMNASGIKLKHVVPGNFQGSPEARDAYQSYYNSVMAVQSFGGYVLSNQYADGNQFNTLQSTLLAQTNNADWFAKVASESIGIVLRQILLFQSQCFVLLSQLVQTQRQMLAAQVMTNTVLIGNNQLNETQLVTKARGVAPAV